MGFFGRRKKKTTSVTQKAKANNGPPLVVMNASSSSITKNNSNSDRKIITRQNTLPEEASMIHVPDLILDLETAVETSSDRPARALRMLFALSEHGHTENRTEMVTCENGRLVPALLNFLNRCARSSSEQYLTLLVLNNISIPSENKRVSFLLCLLFC
jgi:hypothetical protein